MPAAFPAPAPAPAGVRHKLEAERLGEAAEAGAGRLEAAAAGGLRRWGGRCARARLSAGGGQLRRLNMVKLVWPWSSNV